jgi:hypothetical protein
MRDILPNRSPKGPRNRGADDPRMRDPRARLMRKLCEGFEVWRACPQSRCRRERHCRGDERACFLRCWNALDEDERQSLRDAARARAAAFRGEPVRPYGAR